jgi:hypothetical protein
MSIGNLKTKGAKGTNYPWQQMVLNSLASLIGNNSSVANAVAKRTKTPNMLRVTNSGVVPGTPFSVSVANVGTNNGTILGAIIKPGETVNFDSGALNNDFLVGSFTYDASGTELLIIYITN